MQYKQSLIPLEYEQSGIGIVQHADSVRCTKMEKKNMFALATLDNCVCVCTSFRVIPRLFMHFARARFPFYVQ